MWIVVIEYVLCWIFMTSLAGGIFSILIEMHLDRFGFLCDAVIHQLFDMIRNLYGENIKKTCQNTCYLVVPNDPKLDCFFPPMMMINVINH